MSLVTEWPLCAYYLPILLVVWLALLAVRQLFFHPLSSFPGPRLAALTPLYKSYHEVIRGGQWLDHVDKLHKLYGNVVRIGPHELHFSDPRAYSKIFSASGHFTKDPTFYACFGVETSTFGFVDPEQARLARETMTLYFNRRAILESESVIQAKVDKLVGLLAASQGKAFDMFYAFRCTTMDVITTYCFQSPSKCLDSRDFKDRLLEDIQTAVSLLWTVKSFPWIIYIIPFLPDSIGQGLQKQSQAFLNVQSFVAEKLEERPLGGKPLGTYRPSFRTLALFDDLKRRFPSMDSMRRFHEGLSLIQAGSDPVANACVVGFFHILRSSSIQRRLEEELRETFPGHSISPTWSDLEKLPYLTAVIKESLRMSHGFVSSLPRVVGPCGADICGQSIPPNTTVSMSAVLIHNNPSIFPEPHHFRPERWLGSKDLSQYLVAFSRGPRMCLGVNMAWAELYLLFGTLFRNLNMVLVGASPGDYTHFDDFFIPRHRGKNLHIQATLIPDTTL